MSNYTPVNDFSAKDAFASGNPSKLILGADIDAETSAIQTAIASKYDGSSGTLTTLATNDTVLVADVSAGTNKTITAQQLWDQESYLPTSATDTTSGTSKEISTGIPSNAKKITITLNGLSTSTAPDAFYLLIGSGSYVGSGYIGSSWDTNSGASTYSGSQFELAVETANTQAFYGTIWLTKHLDSSNTWIMSCNIVSASGYVMIGSGRKALSGALDRLKITSSNAFDNGAFNILVEI